MRVSLFLFSEADLTIKVKVKNEQLFDHFRHFHVEMVFTRDLKPLLNKQWDSIRAKLFV